MKDISELRKGINRVDREMAALFEERMHCVREIAAYKKARGLPVYDPEREREVISKNAEAIQDSEIRSSYINFLKDEMRISRQYQERILSGAKIAYSGVEGAFAEIAARRIFPGGELISCRNFREAFKNTEEGITDIAVLPLENSYAGEVGQVMDLLYTGSLYINAIWSLDVSQNLLGIPGSSLSEIRTVVSHPQALDQCAAFIEKHGFRTVTDVNTAVAARKTAESGDPHTAAIASLETAKLYGLSVLERDIAGSRDNTTRFAVLSRIPALPEEHSGDLTYIMMFTVKNEAGALSRAVQVIGESGYNMKVLRSRPDREHAWQFYFYIEAEAEEGAVPFGDMTKLLRKHCVNLKILGSSAPDRKAGGDSE